MIPQNSRNRWSRAAGAKALPTALVLILAAAGYANAAPYRYFRFTPTKLASGALATQISEFEFSKAGTKITYPVGTTVVSSAPGADGGTDPGTGVKSEAAIWVIDGSTATKWYNAGSGGAISSILIDVGDGNSIDADGYRFATANDSITRTPVSWKLEASNDNSTWLGLDIESDITPPTTFLTFTSIFALPVEVPPDIAGFDYTPVIVLNGQPFTLHFTADNATSISLTPGTNPTFNPVEDSKPITAPNNVDTTYSLVATNATTGLHSTPSTFTIRSVAGQTVNYRYVRYTPIKTGGGSIQLAELQFETVSPTGDILSTITPVSAVYDGGAPLDPADVETPANIIDGLAGTKWFSGSLRPVVIDFGSPQSFNRYSYQLGADSDFYTGRDPLRWKMEGKNDGGNWKTIEDFEAFDYPVQAISNAFIADIPLPGNSLPLTLTSFSAIRDGTTGVTTLSWSVAGEKTLTLTAGSGTPVDVDNAGGSLVVTPPAANTLYTLHAVSSLDPSQSLTQTLTLSPAVTTVPASPNYTDFTTTGAGIVTNGTAKLINDFPSVQLAPVGDKLRLSIVPDSGGVTGSAYFVNKLPVAGGFDTTFDLIIATKDRGYGADGISFVIQNTPDGNKSLVSSGAQYGPAVNATAIDFSTWDGTIAPQNEAVVKVIRNQVVQQSYDVSQTTVALHSKLFPAPNNGYHASFVGPYSSPAYKVHITYSAAKLLNLSIDGVQIVTDLSLDLGDSVDSSGNAYVGFSAYNGGFTEYSDLASWVLTTNGSTPTNPLTITSSSFNFTDNTVTLNFTSNSGTTYKATHSATLNGTDWTAIGAPVLATSGTSQLIVPFTKGTKDFFRVEVGP